MAEKRNRNRNLDNQQLNTGRDQQQTERSDRDNRLQEEQRAGNQQTDNKDKIQENRSGAPLEDFVE